MLKKIIIRGFILSGLIFFSIARLYSAVYYISPSGNEENYNMEKLQNNRQSIINRDSGASVSPDFAIDNVAPFRLWRNLAPRTPVNNLGVSNITEESVTLAWTALGNDGDVGTAISYDIRYHTLEISEDSWASAAQCDGEPVPNTSGSSESFIVTELSTGTTYYFALKTSDGLNTSDISNCIGAVPRDIIEPSAVSDLSAVSSGVDEVCVELTWTATGDDKDLGIAAQYDIRYALFSINEQNWDDATQCSNEPSPKISGSIESFTVIGLTLDGIYYFALKVIDEFNNSAAVSNNSSVSIGVTIYESEDLAGIRVYPNPCNKNKGYSAVYITRLSDNAEVEIYSINGKLVRELKEQNGIVEWDLKNGNGEEVASGVYIYLAVDDKGNKKRGKIAVIK